VRKPPAQNTMAGLAQAAGVSESTVSRALSDSPLVNPETRDRIKAMAAKMGYQVNPAARMLRSRKTRTIALMIPLQHDAEQHISDPFFTSILGRIADAVSDEGYDLLLVRARTDEAGWPLDPVRAGRADGVIIIGQSYLMERLNQAGKEDAPFVVWGAGRPGLTYPTVGSDNAAGGALLADHLVDAGCRTFAFLGDVGLAEVADRHAGFVAQVRKHGLDDAAVTTATVHFDAEEAYREIRSLLESGLRADAIVASSDVMAMSALRALADFGLKAPDDVRLTGFDGMDLAAMTVPPLTTVRQNLDAGARQLVRSLLARIDGKTVRSVALQTELVVRASSLAASQRNQKTSTAVTATSRRDRNL
jgi:DNA-binding LacI/PurR family transcriptional regulator